ncbi:MAG: LytTR family DNA-binding domain-containing protein [Culicoidibacterales bacterium]
MKIILNIDKQAEESIKITSNEYTEEIAIIYRKLQDRMAKQIVISGFLAGKEYFLTIKEILFFETEADFVYAHGATKAYQTKQKLYNLEKILPANFIRISKSTILNTNYLQAIESSLTGPRRIHCKNAKKVVYVSRKYYPELKAHLNKRQNIL